MRTIFAHVSRLTCTAAVLMGLILSLGPVRAEAAPALHPAATLQDLINGTPEGGTVQIPAGSYTESLTINKRLTLSGPAPAQGAATITAVTGSRVITVSDGKDLTLVNLTLTGGQPSGGGAGGAVYVKNSNLTIEACILWGNQASYGGGIFLDTSGTVTVTDSFIQNNQASIDGGGIYSAGPVTLTNVLLNTNVAGRHGGGVSVGAGKFSATAGEIKDNQAGKNGGGANVNDSVYVHGAWISGNTSGEDGGGILQWNGNNGSTVVIEETLFWSNTAVYHGGGLAVAQGAETTINHSTFMQNTVDSKNTTETYGGGVYFDEQTLTNSITINKTIFESNKAVCSGCIVGNSGGGVYAKVNLPGLLKLNGDTFHANNAWDGGGVYANHNQIMDTLFNQNTGGYGAGAYLWGNSFVQGCEFYKNNAANRGGGLMVPPASPGVSVYFTKFTGNIGGYVGGGAFEIDAAGALLDGIAVANTRVANGSAININSSGANINFDHLTVSGTTTPSGRAGAIYIQQAHNVNFKNTLLSGNDVAVKIDACTACTLDHTLFYDNTTNKASLVLISSQNELSGNPLLGPDGFHLASTLSAAINAGTPTTAAQDIDGDSLDSSPDVGADEYRTHTFVPAVRK